MNTSLNCFLVPLFSLLLLISCGQHSISTERDKYAKLQDSIKGWIANDELVGAELLIIENEELLFHEAIGWSDKENGDLLDKGAIWTVMSMTKPFTATAILMLIEDGLITLEDPLTDFIPSFNGYKATTIRNLLAQSSGDDGKHGDGGHNVLDFNSLDEWIGDWSNQDSNGNFGEFAYSNFNYGALAYIVQQVSKMPVDVFIKTRIIEPLNLKNTYVSFTPDASWANQVPSRYHWIDSTSTYEKSWSSDEPPSWQFFTGALGLWMSAEDYATFMHMWMNKGRVDNVQVLEETSIEEALKIQAKAYGEDLFGHGYGWFIDEKPLIFRYGGSAGGIGVGYPDKEVIVIYLTHCAGGNHKNQFQDALDSIWFPNDS